MLLPIHFRRDSTIAVLFAAVALSTSVALAQEEGSAGDIETCGQEKVCGIPCPVPVPPPARGFAIAVLIFAGLCCLLGILTFVTVKGQSENFFVAGRSLSLGLVVATLASQSLDSNALLGNVDNSYKFHFWDGASIPIGLGLSLVLNGVFLARHVNGENVLTLPDIYAKRYGRLMEVLVSITTMVSFLFLLAGNLVGMAAILGYLLDMDNPTAAVWLSMFIILIYTVCGGLFSVVYTDCVQAVIGWLGCLTTASYILHNRDEYNVPPPSVGFPGYIYPDSKGDGGICDLYDGQPCVTDETMCCYNNITKPPSDNGAYPLGDQIIFDDQMTNPRSLTPFPNAIFFNWATIFVLGFGNLAALDFQVRCMASKTPRIATIGCIIAGCLTFVVGVPFAYLGAITRNVYGPDSVHAEFEPNTCSEILGLPTCAEWKPDSKAFLKLLTHDVPPFIGGWCLIGFVAASMSTADGALLAMGTVLSNNILRHAKNYFNSDKLLLAARISMIPFGVAAAAIATAKAGETGYLLIVAFDVTFASVVVPLFGCFYAKTPRPAAGLFSLLAGSFTRIILEFTIPKDGFLVLPFDGDEFLNYGPAASSKLPVFVDSTNAWNPEEEPCDQKRFSDFTGADSLGSAFVSLVVFIAIQWLERNKDPNESWLSRWSFMRPIVVQDKPEEVGAVEEPKKLGWLGRQVQRRSTFLGQSTERLKRLTSSFRVVKGPVAGADPPKDLSCDDKFADESD